MKEFDRWLNEVQRIAKGAEWEITRTAPRFKQWFDMGLSAHEAVTCLFELARQQRD